MLLNFSEPVLREETNRGECGKFSFLVESIQGTERPALWDKGLEWPVHFFLRVVGCPPEPSREEGLPWAPGFVPAQSEVFGAFCCFHHPSQGPGPYPSNPTINWGGMRVPSRLWDAGLGSGQDGKAPVATGARAGQKLNHSLPWQGAGWEESLKPFVLAS